MPGSGEDIVLYLGLALACALACGTRLSALGGILLGAAFQAASFQANLGHVSNAITLWLSMHVRGQKPEDAA